MRLNTSFFNRDVLTVAPELLGKRIILNNSINLSYIITEVEAYRGEEDKACHAAKGRTKRTEIMYASGGHVYVYLIYGMYWMLNFVTGAENNPQAVLVRGLKNISGPGRVGKALQLDKSFYGENLGQSDRIWVENGVVPSNIKTSTRIGIDYAGDVWMNKPWRFFIE